jgi:cbb3-type cytochrome oxidase maturation protein
MNVLVYLVPLALLLGLTGLAAFLWSLRNGQYDDMDGAAIRILPDDDIEAATPAATTTPAVTSQLPKRRMPAPQTEG